MREVVRLAVAYDVAAALVSYQADYCRKEKCMAANNRHRAGALVAFMLRCVERMPPGDAELWQLHFVLCKPPLTPNEALAKRLRVLRVLKRRTRHQIAGY